MASKEDKERKDAFDKAGMSHYEPDGSLSDKFSGPVPGVSNPTADEVEAESTRRRSIAEEATADIDEKIEKLREEREEKLEKALEEADKDKDKSAVPEPKDGEEVKESKPKKSTAKKTTARKSDSKDSSDKSDKKDGDK